MLAGYPELKVQTDQSFDCSCLSPSGAHCLTSSSSLSSISLQHPGASRLIISPQSQTHHFPPTPHLATRLSLSLFLSFAGICLYFPASFFTLQPGIFPSPSHALLSGIFSLHTSPQLLSSRFLSSVQIFCFSFHHFPCSLQPSPCSSLPT